MPNFIRQLIFFITHQKHNFYQLKYKSHNAYHHATAINWYFYMVNSSKNKIPQSCYLTTTYFRFILCFLKVVLYNSQRLPFVDLISTKIYVQKGKGKQKFGLDKNSIKKDYIHTMEWYYFWQLLFCTKMWAGTELSSLFGWRCLDIYVEV